MSKLKNLVLLTVIFGAVANAIADTPTDTKVHLCYKSHSSYIMRMCNAPGKSAADCFGTVSGGGILAKDQQLDPGANLVIEAADYKAVPGWRTDPDWQTVVDVIKNAPAGSYFMVTLEGPWPFKATVTYKQDTKVFPEFTACITPLSLPPGGM